MATYEMSIDDALDQLRDLARDEGDQYPKDAEAARIVLADRERVIRQRDKVAGWHGIDLAELDEAVS